MYSTGQIAKALNVTHYRVTYWLRKRRVQPVGRVGGVDVYSDEQVEALRQVFAKQDAEAAGGE